MAVKLHTLAQGSYVVCNVLQRPMRYKHPSFVLMTGTLPMLDRATLQRFARYIMKRSCEAAHLPVPCAWTAYATGPQGYATAAHNVPYRQPGNISKPRRVESLESEYFSEDEVSDISED